MLVRRGIYNETLVVNKTVSLIGEDRNFTIIDAQKAHAQVILIEACYVIVANFTLGNSGYNPPRNSGWNQVNGEGDGIRIHTPPIGGFPYPQNITVTNTTIIGCPLYAIDIDLTYFDNVSGNLIIGTVTGVVGDVLGLGIRVGCLNSTIANNVIANTFTGVELASRYIELGYQTYDVNESNTIEGNQVISLAVVPSPFPSQSPTPSPTIAEFPSWIILPLITATLAVLVYIKKETQRRP